MYAKNHKNLLLIDQCALHTNNTAFLRNHAFTRHHRKQVIRKTVSMIDEGLLENAAQMKLDVLSAMQSIAEDWRLIHPLQSRTVKCDF
jgi:hypothetical protein